MAAAGATEARLLVSTDGGTNWAEAARAAPGEGGFRYAAPADGDYWFSVLTVDAAGNPAPANVEITSQLHVRVDRTPPPVALEAAPFGPETVAVRWAVSDPAAVPGSLEVTFTPDGGAAQPVPVAVGLAGTFQIPADRAAGVVRVSVRDAAGNVGTAVRRTGGTEPLAPATDPFAPVPSSNGPTLAAPAPVPVGGADAFGTTFPALPTAARQGGAIPAPAPLAAAAPSSRTAAAPSVPTDPAAPVLRDRGFKIGYAVDAVGSSGVGRVEIFITPDGGRHWYSYGEDADRRSPADVTVPGDGEYGFCVRVRSGAGLSESPPRPGESPDVRVTVDGTPPAVEILSAGQGRGPDADSIAVAWRISEDRPADRPVRVELGQTAAGPWEAVGGWSADAGSARVPLRPGTAGRVYVRVTARDRAGNERGAVTPNGVAVDLARPTARVIGVVQ